MSDPFIGQIMLASFGYAPKSWAQCNGATLPISQNQALFSLLGTTYGGDGISTFQLPDLRSRTPVGTSNALPLGQAGGVENVTLLATQIPQHVHAAAYASQAGAVRNPANALYGDTGAANPIYASATGPQVPLNAVTVGNNSTGQPHTNLQPYSVLNFCIALSGVYPSRN
ncbi:phage tail protein [Cognatiluteimonas telluris]|jgi:microcystin-dependent protein|uniref:phage tail protein n=1 Tax=Cognatiluteimonas telluris TaxID=1104775 RepID=UPI00140D08CC|nr:tail fiber protein [Lysobacter telluris]